MTLLAHYISRQFLTIMTSPNEMFLDLDLRKLGQMPDAQKANLSASEAAIL